MSEIEIIDQPVENHIVKVRYIDGSTGEISNREYTYYSEEPLNVGDLVTVPVKDTVGKAQVTAVDVPESTITSFRDKVKTIPAGSKTTLPIIQQVVTTQPPQPEPETYEKSDALVVVEQKAEDMSIQVFQVNEITTPELWQEAENWLSVVRIQLQDADKARVADVKKPNEYVKWINGKYREKTDLLRKMEQHCLKVIGGWRQKERERQEHEQEKADRLAQRQFDAQVAKGEMPVVPVPVARHIEGLAPTAETGAAKNIWGTEWDFEIAKADAVPREYCIPDEKRIRQYAKLMKDKAVMAGIRFFEKDVVQVRRAKVEEPK